MERARGERIGAREMMEREKRRKRKKGGGMKTGIVARRINGREKGQGQNGHKGQQGGIWRGKGQEQGQGGGNFFMVSSYHNFLLQR